MSNYCHLDLRPIVSELYFAQQGLEVFDAWFSRSHRMLRFLACKLLGNPEAAELAIHNCWLSASKKPPRFDREGAFRSWLARLLITEALAIRRQNRNGVISLHPALRAAEKACNQQQ